jgi:hypothetical protein
VLAVGFSLLLLALPGLFLLKQLQQVRTELAGAKRTSAELECRNDEQQQALQSEQSASQPGRRIEPAVAVTVLFNDPSDRE